MKLFTALTFAAALALVACAAPATAAPAGATAVDFVQYAAVGPAERIAVVGFGETIVPLDAGDIAGIDLIASDGLVRARGVCRAFVASADIDATGPVNAHFEVGRRGDVLWQHVAGRKSDQVPLAPVFVPSGQWMRLRIQNPNPGPIDIQPGTRVSVLALDCMDPTPPIRQAGAGWVPKARLAAVELDPGHDLTAPPVSHPPAPRALQPDAPASWSTPVLRGAVTLRPST